MNDKNTEKLFTDFSRLYRGRHETIETNLMSWGFCCGDGWFDLIYELSEKVVKHVEENGLDPKVTQVKEKFGGLRFYVEDGDEHIERLNEEYELLSFKICETCGNSAKTHNQSGWNFTRCDQCFREESLYKFVDL